jgi:hypothetical protein
MGIVHGLSPDPVGSRTRIQQNAASEGQASTMHPGLRESRSGTAVSVRFIKESDMN